MTAPPLPYDRSPSPELFKLLWNGGLLEPLLALPKRVTNGFTHDVHFRRNDEVCVYRGMARVLVAQLISDGVVNISAHRRYAAQSCARGLFGIWKVGEPGFGRELDTYLSCVEVGPNWTHGEGAIQMQWSQVRDPWVPFDREAALGYESTAHRQEARVFPQVQEAQAKLESVYRESLSEVESGRRWEEPPVRRQRDELDQLAVDSDGRLVLVELKDAASHDTGALYYAPFQLLRYVWVWNSALDAVRGGLQTLITVREALGLAAPDGYRLSGGVRAVVAFGCDTRSESVRDRYRRVLKVADQHLPPDVGGIETWSYTGDGPRRVA